MSWADWPSSPHYTLIYRKVLFPMPFPTHITRRMGDYEFQIPTTLQPGDALSENDALAYNSWRSDRIMANFEPTFKSMLADNASKEDLDAAIAERSARYVFGQHPGQLSDLDKEMRQIADRELSQAAKARDIEYDKLDAQERNRLRSRHLAAHEERIRKQAQGNLDALAATLAELGNIFDQAED